MFIYSILKLFSEIVYIFDDRFQFTALKCKKDTVGNGTYCHR